MEISALKAVSQNRCKPNRE